MRSGSITILLIAFAMICPFFFFQMDRSSHHNTDIVTATAYKRRIHDENKNSQLGNDICLKVSNQRLNIVSPTLV